ncbi:MAG: hypothetical protein K2X66_17225, partial [Cyanobacteria bacterium]|nr:hypothetical protein [Cyanobacteriota bacterium]
GATELYNNTIRQIGMRLLSEGKITSEQANQFSNLANSGHGLAQVSKFYEDASSQLGMNPTDYSSKILPFMNNQIANKKDISNIDPDIRKMFNIQPEYTEVAFDANGMTKRDAQGNYIFDTANPTKSYLFPEQMNFVNTFAQLKQKGALSDPNLNSLVSTLSQKILALTVSTSIYGNRGAMPRYGFDPQNLKSQLVSDFHANASNICAAGNGKDSGVYCPPVKNKG